MDAGELLRNWPGWQRAGAETVLASPAWRMPVRMGNSVATMTVLADPPDDVLLLDVTLDDEPHRLVLVDSPAFPDLHLLWARRRELPSALLLALVEKECGAVFSLVESVTRRLLAVKGLAAAEGACRFFEVAADAVRISFGLDASPDLIAPLGRLDYLDPAHPSIRESTRAVRAVVGALALSDEDLAALVPGTCVLLPEGFGDAAGWVPADELDASDALSVVVPGEAELSFAAFADEAYPPVPESDSLELVRGGRRLFACASARVGDARALKVVETAD